MTAAVILAGAVLAELVALFACWTWLSGSRSPLWLLTGFVAALVFGGLVVAMPQEAGRTLPLFLGVYVCAGLLWTWIIERGAPPAWHLGERAVVTFGVVLCVSALLL